jgi:hypothetical protein
VKEEEDEKSEDEQEVARTAWEEVIKNDGLAVANEGDDGVGGGSGESERDVSTGSAVWVASYIGLTDLCEPTDVSLDVPDGCPVERGAQGQSSETESRPRWAALASSSLLSTAKGGGSADNHQDRISKGATLEEGGEDWLKMREP